MLRRSCSDGKTGKTVVGKTQNTRSTSSALKRLGANQLIPSGTAGTSRSKSPNVRVQSKPASHHEKKAWQSGGVHVRVFGIEMETCEQCGGRCGSSPARALVPGRSFRRFLARFSARAIAPAPSSPRRRNPAVSSRNRRRSRPSPAAMMACSASTRSCGPWARIKGQLPLPTRTNYRSNAARGKPDWRIIECIVPMQISARSGTTTVRVLAPSGFCMTT